MFFPKKISSLLKFIFLFSCLGLSAFLYFSGDQDLITLFPIENYNQNILAWIPPAQVDDTSLLSAEMQQHHMEAFYKHYFGALSPWSADRVNQILHQAAPNDLKTLEQNIVLSFSNQNKSDSNLLGYGSNFRPYPPQWIAGVAANIDFSQLESGSFQTERQAIAIDNLHARALPTEDVYFYSYKLAGQGYPFDNLQISSVWVGSPLYVLAKTHDQAWSLVLTPDFIAWVKTSGLAYVNEDFVHQWQEAAKKNLAAIVRSQTSLNDDNGHFRFTAYVGAVFPAEVEGSHLKLLIPVADAQRRALIQHSFVSAEQAVLMPFSASPRHLIQLLNALIGRPYGWGGIYFYNDCSAELKSLLTPFGIWLPRHSSEQVNAGKMIDFSTAAPAQRLTYLMANGRRFMTIVYIGSHVFMYVGNYLNPNEHSSTPVALSYQNVWGLRPIPPTRRAVIGESVLFPLLLQYPEDRSLDSLLNKQYFQVAYLDEMPSDRLKLEAVDLKALMSSVD